MEEQRIDWPESHRDYWIKLAATVGATEQQARFAYGISTGMSATASARFAGYAGEPRTAGYAAVRTRAVTTLLAMAAADGWESPSRMVSEEEKTKLLNALMRSQDPQVRLRAIEASDKRREREIERERLEAEERRQSENPLDLLSELAEIAPLYAILLAKKNGLLAAWKPKAPEITADAALAEIESLKELVSSLAKTAATPAD
jgi:hypothetical protein